MTNKQAYLALLSGLVFLLTGCDLLKVFSEGKGQPKLSRVELVDLVTPLPPRSPLLGEPPRNSQPIKQQRTNICAEFSSMAVSDLPTSPWPIFVDAKVAQSGSGSSWKDAVKSVGEGLRKAQWQRQQWVASANKDRPILVVVAGGTYSFDHERAAKQASGGGAMSDGASLLAFTGVQFSNGIEVLGGYFPGDPCREIAINLQDNPSSALGRETILDGQDKSDHVILLMADDPAHTKDIAIKDLTIRGGHAQGNDLADAVLSKLKKMGGAIAIRGSANHIEIERVKLANSSADKSGGCIAITQKANNIKLDKVSFDNCSAFEDGGAMYIADSAKIITIDNTTATNNKAGRNGGALAITSADVVANSGLAVGATAAQIYAASVENIEVKNSNFNTNQAVSAGGGVAIVKTNLDPAHVLATNIEPVFAPNISFTNTKINANKVTNAAAKGGGGLALIDKVDQIFISGGEISNNESAAGLGAGVLIKDSVHEVKLNGVNITANKFSAGVVNNGVGLAVTGIAGKEIKALSISGGQISDHLGATNGSGLYVVSANGVFLKGNVLLSGNIAQSGGGAYLDEVKNLSIDGVFCIDNFASVGSGGGVYLAKTHLLDHARVVYSANASVQDGGALYVSGSYDNTLALTNKAMPMDNITCQSNHAAGHGGCAYIKGAPDTIIRSGSYTANGKSRPAAGSMPLVTGCQKGGAIYYHAAGVNLKLVVRDHANFDNNQANEGGALFVDNLKELKLTNNPRFNTNHAIGGAPNGRGGAISGVYANNAKVWLDTGASLTANTAIGSGGALYLEDNKLLELHIENSSIVDDNVTSKGSGGAVYVGFIVGAASKLGLNGQFKNNRAESAAQKGGAVYVVSAPRTAEIGTVGGLFEGNKANDGGGALAFDGANAIADLKIENAAKFTRNSTINGSGGAVLVSVGINNSNPLRGQYKGNQAPLGQGAGVTYLGNLPAAVFKTDGAKFDGNVAPQNPAIYLAKIPAAGLEFVKTDFKNHKSVSAGCGGVMNIATAINSLTFDGGEISGNDTNLIAANGHGGAFCATRIDTKLEVKNLIVNSNVASTGSGGFLYVADNVSRPNITIDNSGFGANKALGGDGGLLRIDNVGNFTATNAKFIGNESSANGGAVAVINNVNDVVIKSVEGAETDGLLLKYYISLLRRVKNYAGLAIESEIGLARKNKAADQGGAFFFANIGGVLNISEQVLVGNSANDGGVLSANTILGNTTVKSTMMGLNTATNNGGALYLGDLKAKNLTISQEDKGFGSLEYVSDRSKRKDFATFYSFLEKIKSGNLDQLNGTDLSGNKRGMFLIEGNTAGSNGGAVYVNNVGDVNITKMSFANNTVTAGSGGTIYLTGLAKTAAINDSIIYGGVASVNAGGLYVKGSGITAKLYLGDSSIQNSVVSQADLSCAGGLFTNTLNDVMVLSSNFFGNVVNSNNVNNLCAGAIKFDNFVGTLRNPAALVPILDGGFTWAGAGALLNDNKVLGIYHANSIGTVLISWAIWNNDIGGVPTVLPAMNGNLPAPAGNELRQVIKSY